MTGDLVGRGKLLVRDVAAPVRGNHRRVDDRPDRGRAEREAQLRPCEATDVQAEVGVGLSLPVEEETRGCRVLAPRRNGRPDYIQINGKKSAQWCAEHHGLQSERPSILEIRRCRIL